ncbi:MAG: TonB-dependent receptor [Opitutaceae bacterium]|jgi:outer membrane receptor protein involved in Fe transport|nr:TonB-dependent receptor [Opitutaceae bacterium]
MRLNPAINPATTTAAILRCFAIACGATALVESGITGPIAAQTASPPATIVAAADTAATATAATTTTTTITTTIDAEIISLERFVVTAEKLERTLQQTRTSVAAYTGADIELANAGTIADIFDRTANLSDNNYSFSIRGIPSAGFGALGEGADLATLMLDNTALDSRMYESGVFNTWDLAQIEILRGPQSTAQGRNSLAGAVVGRTRDPSFNWDARARASRASKNTTQLAAAAGGPVIPDWLAFRVSVDRQTTDGAVTNITRNDPDWGTRDITTLRGKLLLQPASWRGFSALAAYSHTRSDNGSPAYIYALGASTAAPADPWAELKQRHSYEDAPHNDLSTSQTASLEINQTLPNGWLLTAITSWYDYDNEAMRDSDNSAVPIGVSFRTYDHDSIAQEVRLLAKGGTWKLLAGLYANTTDKHWRVGGDMPYYLAPTLYAIYYSDVRTHNKVTNTAAFLNGEWTPLPRLTLAAALRYDHEKADNSTNQAVSLTAGTGDPGIDAFIQTIIDGANNASAGANTLGVLLPTASATYHWTPDISTGLSLTRGYRSGGVSINLARGAATPFDPEYTWNYELSLRSQFFNKTLLINANLYYIDWKDQQVGVTLSDTLFDTRTANAGKSTLHGGEIEVREKITTQWTLWQTIGCSHTRFDDFRDAGVDYTGHKFPFAPQWTLGAGAAWQHPAGWFATAHFNYTANSHADARNRPDLTLGPRRLLTAKAGYAARQWSAYAFGGNLLDDFYMTSRWADAAAYASAGTAGTTRLIGVALEARY